MNIGRIRKIERLPRHKQEEYREALKAFVERAEGLDRNDRTVKRARKLLQKLEMPPELMAELP